jgi:hypothetical protein
VKKLILLSALLVFFGSYHFSAQQVKPVPAKAPPKASEVDPDLIERAHHSLYNPPAKPSEEANSLTQEVASALPNAAKASFDRAPRKSFIDDYIFRAIENDHIPHSQLSSDQEFVRRIYLDINGVIPSPEQTRDFLQSKDPQKRARLVDSLVGSEDYLSHWTYFFNDIFRVNTKMGRGRMLWHYWTKEWLRVDRSYADVVREMITAGGKSNFSVPGTNLISRENVVSKFQPDNPDDYNLLNRLDTFDEYNVMLSRAFLGMNTSCISCHDGAHHLEQVNAYLAGKKRMEFFQQSAFMGYTRVVMGYDFVQGAPEDSHFLVMDNTSNGYNTVDDSPWYTESMVRLPRKGLGVVEPAFLLTGEKPKPGENWRQGLARMITADRQFARATVNRIWAAMMAFGIVEPIDEFDLARLDPANPPQRPWTLQPSNPPLLEALTDEFIKHNYSIRHMIKLIAESNAYQLSATFDGEWKESYTPYYSRKFVRQLRPYELIDSIQVATGVEGEYSLGSAKVPRLSQIATPEELRGPAAPTLDLARAFFLSNRDNPARPHIDGSARQALLLMNSPVVTSRVQAKGNTRIAELLKAYPARANDKVIADLYLSFLNRAPSAEELQVAQNALAKDRTKGAEDLAWVLINNPEFIFNH